MFQLYLKSVSEFKQMRNYLYTTPLAREFLKQQLGLSMDTAVKNAALSTPKHNWCLQHRAAKIHSKGKQKKGCCQGIWDFTCSDTHLVRSTSILIYKKRMDSLSLKSHFLYKHIRNCVHRWCFTYTEFYSSVGSIILSQERKKGISIKMESLG